MAAREGPFIDSLHCVRCGYALRGLREDAKCPECGTSVAASRYDLLRHADPLWLATLHRGMNVAHYGRLGFIASLICLLLTLAIGVALLPVMKDTVAETIANALYYAFNFLLVGAFFGVGVGAWCLSAPEPRESEARTLPYLYRALSGLLVPAVGMWFYLSGAQPLEPMHWSLQQVAVQLCFALVALHGGLTIAMARRIERRIQGPLDSGRSGPRLALRAFVVLVGAVWVLHWIGPLFAHWPPGSIRLPGEGSQMFLFMFIMLLWFAALGNLLHLHSAVSQERGASTPTSA